MTSLVQDVQEVFVQMTRYPVELFSLEADFEEELGIDSVKLAEIYAALQKRFGLVANLDGVEIRNLGDVIGLIEAHLGEPVAVGVEAQQANVASAAQVVNRLASTTAGFTPVSNSTWFDPEPPSPVHPELLKATSQQLSHKAAQAGRDEVIAIFSEVTRYPTELFKDDADLEEDLGIDSVKQAEILMVLSNRFQLPKAENDTFQDIRTVGDVIAKIDQLSPQPALTTSKNAPNQPNMELSQDRALPFLDDATGAKPFAGKIAFISGSGHGIGAAIVKRLATLGAHVIVNSFHSRDRGEATAAAIRQAGGQATHLWGSTAKADHLEKIFATIERDFGGLDFFISNASNGLIAPLEAIQPEHWDRAFRTNVVGLHQGAMLAAKLMAKRGGGRIIAMSSPGAQRTIDHFACMGSVKAAVESLVRYLAVAFQHDNIQVNAISAGPVQGELLHKYPDSDRLIPYWQSLTTGGDLATEDDIADAVVFLLSPLARKISGSVQLIDATASLRI